jgi:hypothetical protein
MDSDAARKVSIQFHLAAYIRQIPGRFEARIALLE